MGEKRAQYKIFYTSVSSNKLTGPFRAISSLSWCRQSVEPHTSEGGKGQHTHRRHNLFVVLPFNEYAALALRCASLISFAFGKVDESSVALPRRSAQSVGETCTGVAFHEVPCDIGLQGGTVLSPYFVEEALADSSSDAVCVRRKVDTPIVKFPLTRYIIT